MNDADFDMLTAKLRNALITQKPGGGGWEFLPEVMLRLRVVELAIDLDRGQSPNTESVLMSAKRLLKFIEGESVENLHGQKQDER